MRNTIFKVRRSGRSEDRLDLADRADRVVSLPCVRWRLPVQIFTLKHSLTLPSQVFAFVERILTEVSHMLWSISDVRREDGRAHPPA